MRGPLKRASHLCDVKTMRKLRRILSVGLLTCFCLAEVTGCQRTSTNVAESSTQTEKEDEVLEEQKEQADLQAEKELEEQKAKEEAKKAEKEAANKEMTEKLTGIVKEEGECGEYSAFTFGLDSKISASYKSRKMQAASLIKLFIAGAVYENWDMVTAQGGEDEINSLLNSMITVSDNNSANSLILKLGEGDEEKGMETVNAYCKDHKLKDTHLGRLLLASNEFDDNYTSVNDCGKFLKAVYYKKVDGAEKILALMKKQERTGKIPAGIPDGIETANKTGELADVENDAAIIFGEEPYILCVMTDKVTAPGSAQQSISAISSRVYQLWEN